VEKGSEGLGLTAKKDLRKGEIIAVFGESVVLRGSIAAEAHKLITNTNTGGTPGTGFQYSIRRKLAGDTDYTIIMPEADIKLARSLPGISPALKKALSQKVGARGWAHLANHTCCHFHRNANLKILSVAGQQGPEQGEAHEISAILRANLPHSY